MNETAFQRARRPEQKARRRADILAAAAELLDAQGIEAATLGAIASRAGVVKSALYRYFASREEILMEILLADIAGAVDEIGAALPAGSASPARAAAAMTAAYAARPRLCLLTSRMASTLETNLSAEAVAGFKRRIMAEVGRAVTCLHAALPALPGGGGERAAMHLHLLVAGLWPFANPVPVVADVMSQPEFAPLRKDFAATLEDGIRAHLLGLLAEGRDFA